MRTTFLLSFSILFTACASEPAEPQPVCERTQTLRVMDLTLPLTAAAATDAGLDLDGDGTIDNQAGNVLSIVVRYFDEVDAQARVSRRIADDVVWRIGVESCDDGTTRTVLDEGTLPLGMIADFADTGEVGWYPAAPATILLGADGTGKIAGAFPEGYANVIASAFLPFVQERFEQGESFGGTALDYNEDGVVELDELMRSETWQILMYPDVDTDGDGDRDALSFGFEAYAVAVE